MLCYAIPVDILEKTFQIEESNALICLKEFCHNLVSEFGKDFLRSPNGADTILIEIQFAEVGFPGCV